MERHHRTQWTSYFQQCEDLGEYALVKAVHIQLYQFQIELNRRS